ncbi:MAG: S1 RNA-binding domain-containing protein, partial [Lachnospiraceae bacterium]|nr:S1 RNA-binding domain-containing protein [Lachnospiraceae bacterium]
AITYLEGIRAFIPASKLALTFVDDPTTYIGKTVQAVVITVNQKEQKLTLSVKDVLKEQEKQERNSRISRLVVGMVVTGTVEQIMPYGAFVSIGDDLSGLLHISQICGRRLKTPTEVIKIGDEVTVKIIDVKDGKVSLSMKAVEEDAEISEEVEEVAPENYVFEDKTASNTMASLFANIKL